MKAVLRNANGIVGEIRLVNGIALPEASLAPYLADLELRHPKTHEPVYETDGRAYLAALLMYWNMTTTHSWIVLEEDEDDAV